MPISINGSPAARPDDPRITLPLRDSAFKPALAARTLAAMLGDLTKRGLA